MQNTFLVIKDALVRLFKEQYPEFDILCEEISRTDGHGNQEEDVENYIFLSMTPAANETWGPCLTDRRVLVDAAVHTRTEDNNGYWRMAGEIDGVLRPTFHFGDRTITVPDIQYAIVDRVLHCVFTLAFMDCREEPSTIPIAEELIFTMRKD